MIRAPNATIAIIVLIGAITKDGTTTKDARHALGAFPAVFKYCGTVLFTKGGSARNFQGIYLIKFEAVNDADRIIKDFGLSAG